MAERKKAQEEQARLTAILEATPDLVGIADPDLRLIYCNEAGLRLLGAGPGFRLSDIDIRRTHPEWAARLVREERELLKRIRPAEDRLTAQVHLYPTAGVTPSIGRPDDP